MRLHPAVGMPLERVVPREGLTVGNVHLPAGTIVGMNAWVIHRDKNVYGEDADIFRPERWTEAEPERLRMMERRFLSVSKILPKFHV
jgi:cytochrome P450